MKTIDDAMRAAIREDGKTMSVNAVADKHGVGWITAKTIIGGSGQKVAGARKAKAQRPASANGGVTIAATPALCDGIWTTLPLEKKAALLSRLAEVS